MDTTARSFPCGVDLNGSLSRTFTRQVAMQIDGTSFTSPTDSLAGYLDSDRFVAEIHPNDNMVAMGRTDLYYWMGKTALDCVKAVAPREEFSRILDFPSGYGRVLRFLRHEFPDAEITACEIDAAATVFCEERFDAVPVVSSEDIKQVRLDGAFDLIWVGSLFTHLNEASAIDLLRLFRASLAENGLLMFSIAGEFVCDLARAGEFGGVPEETIWRMTEEFDRRGFAFGSYNPGIADEANYGRAFIRRDWLDEMRIAVGGLSNVNYIWRGYARRQDVVAWRRCST